MYVDNIFYNIGFVKGTLEAISDNNIKMKQEELETKLNELIYILDIVAEQAEKLVKTKKVEVHNFPQIIHF